MKFFTVNVNCIQCYNNNKLHIYKKKCCEEYAPNLKFTSGIKFTLHIPHDEYIRYCRIHIVFSTKIMHNSILSTSFTTVDISLEIC